MSYDCCTWYRHINNVWRMTKKRSKRGWVDDATREEMLQRCHSSQRIPERERSQISDPRGSSCISYLGWQLELNLCNYIHRNTTILIHIWIYSYSYSFALRTCRSKLIQLCHAWLPSLWGSIVIKMKSAYGLISSSSVGKLEL